MNKRARFTSIMLLTAAVVSASYVAFAATEHYENDAGAIDDARVTMNDALATALNIVPGKPARAELESEEGRLQWDIEVASARGVYDLAIDAHSGELLHKSLDKPDHGEDERD